MVTGDGKTDIILKVTLNELQTLGNCILIPAYELMCAANMLKVIPHVKLKTWNESKREYTFVNATYRTHGTYAINEVQTALWQWAWAKKQICSLTTLIVIYNGCVELNYTNQTYVAV